MIGTRFNLRVIIRPRRRVEAKNPAAGAQIIPILPVEVKEVLRLLSAYESFIFIMDSRLPGKAKSTVSLP
jgi:hypothetical protein